MRTLLLAFMLLLATDFSVAQETQHSFKIGENDFLLDGKPFQIISGEMHFARIPREYWHDRLKTAKKMGLNTICTYVFWNYHETEKGIYNFSENADVAAFVKAAQEEGLWVIIRPSPYACAEWEFGAYPYWLLNEKNLKVRSRDSVFLALSNNYIQAFAKELVPLQISNGGPVIMLQIENEYGSYDSDKEYLGINKEMLREAGFTVELYTCDGPSQMPKGYLPGILPAVNGFDNIQGVKELINKYNNGHGPYFIAEWYPAWFDSWGEKHHTFPVESFIETYKKVLEAGFSINIYMVHGGTTRGFWNGANMPPFRPQTSSYDYDAPIDEAGNITPKYLAMQKVIFDHQKKQAPTPSVRNKTIKIPSIIFEKSADLFENLTYPVEAVHPLTFEDLHQGYGLVLYRSIIKKPAKGFLRITNVRDYAIVFINGKRIGILDRRLNQDSLFLDIAEECKLEILVENMGRINYGEFLNDNNKGITKAVFFDGQEVLNWKMFRIPFSKFPEFESSENTMFFTPVIKKASFDLPEIGDTYLDLTNWGKGVVWLNGHNLGRYWNIGPTQTIYIPAPWLKQKDNELIIFDELKYDVFEISCIENPIIDKTHIIDLQIKTIIESENSVNFSLSSSDKMAEYFLNIQDTSGTQNIKYTAPLRIDKRSNLEIKAINPLTQSETLKNLCIYPSLSSGQKVEYLSNYSKKYMANEEMNFVDGLLGSTNFNDGFWQGYEAKDLDIILDLGKAKKVKSIRINFLKDVKSWIFLPTEVEILVSKDGAIYYELQVIYKADSTLSEQISIVAAQANTINKDKIRFVKIRAKNTGKCPANHPGAGASAWLFADEIIVE